MQLGLRTTLPVTTIALWPWTSLMCGTMCCSEDYPPLPIPPSWELWIHLSQLGCSLPSQEQIPPWEKSSPM
jgi:hypothetical protein